MSPECGALGSAAPAAADADPVFARIDCERFEPRLVALNELGFLTAQDARKCERATRLYTRGETRSELGEWARENVRDERIGRLFRKRVGRNERESVGDAVPLRVVATRRERLRIVVDADDARRTEFQRGDRKYAGAATVIDDGKTGKIECIEPFEAERGRRM